VSDCDLIDFFLLESVHTVIKTCRRMRPVLEFIRFHDPHMCTLSARRPLLAEHHDGLGQEADLDSPGNFVASVLLSLAHQGVCSDYTKLVVSHWTD
jgi:hypothetical protein